MVRFSFGNFAPCSSSKSFLPLGSSEPTFLIGQKWKYSNASGTFSSILPKSQRNGLKIWPRDHNEEETEEVRDNSREGGGPCWERWSGWGRKQVGGGVLVWCSWHSHPSLFTRSCQSPSMLASLLTWGLRGGVARITMAMITRRQHYGSDSAETFIKKKNKDTRFLQINSY